MASVKINQLLHCTINSILHPEVHRNPNSIQIEEKTGVTIMSKMKHIATSGLRTLFEHAGRARVRRSLLSYSDRALKDMGISKALLKAGISAWPWRVEDEANIGDIEFSNLKPYSKSINHEQALNELRAYSDTDLADLGLYRINPQRTMVDGRPGIDGHEQAAA